MADYSPFRLLQTTVSQSGVALVMIANGPMNIITAELYEEYTKLVPMLANDEAVRVVVFKSATPGSHMAHFDVGAFL